MPGIAGQKTELTDGAKIDTINEYTTGSGVALQGRTNGIAPTTGFVGEMVTSGAMSVTGTTLAKVWVDVTGASITLTAGNWLVFIGATMQALNQVGTLIDYFARVALFDSANNLIPGSVMLQDFIMLSTVNTHTFSMSEVVPVRPTTSTTYKLRIECGYAAATAITRFLVGGVGDFDANDCTPYFYAVRIS